MFDRLVSGVWEDTEDRNSDHFELITWLQNRSRAIRPAHLMMDKQQITAHNFTEYGAACAIRRNDILALWRPLRCCKDYTAEFRAYGQLWLSIVYQRFIAFCEMWSVWLLHGLRLIIDRLLQLRTAWKKRRMRKQTTKSHRDGWTHWSTAYRVSCIAA